MIGIPTSRRSRCFRQRRPGAHLRPFRAPDRESGRAVPLLECGTRPAADFVVTRRQRDAVWELPTFPLHCSVPPLACCEQHLSVFCTTCCVSLSPSVLDFRLTLKLTALLSQRGQICSPHKARSNAKAQPHTNCCHRPLKGLQCNGHVSGDPHKCSFNSSSFICSVSSRVIGIARKL